MSQTEAPANSEVDLSACEHEPIHLPGSIQPHGTLLVLRASDGAITQYAVNAQSFLGIDASQELLGSTLSSIFDPLQGEALLAALRAIPLERTSTFLKTVALPAGHFHAIGHRADDLLVLEFERADAAAPIGFETIHGKVRAFMVQMEGATSLYGISQLAATEIRRITGFDRVLVYRFDEHWNGSVVAEDRNDQLPSYLGLRFPASDIPAQARELYRVNRLRLIADANYTPVPIIPASRLDSDQPLDLSHAALRSVSPIHLEYMKNMETGASMSISIVKEGVLWGLISCHNRQPKVASFEVRAACDFLGQILSLQLASQESHADLTYRTRLKSQQTRLLSLLAQTDNLLDGLEQHASEFMSTVSATGLATVHEKQVRTCGVSPGADQVLQLIEWLESSGDHEVFSTDSLASLYPSAAGFADKASGLLAIKVSQVRPIYVLWFRTEELQTVKWAGDPRKSLTQTADGLRLHPRKSFETWKETVRAKSLPWRPAEIETVTELRSAITTILLKKAEELAQMNEELRRSNRELEAFSYSVSHDLRAPFRHIVGYSELVRDQAQDLPPNIQRYLDTIIDSAHFAGRLVDNLLHFSQVGRATLQMTSVDMSIVVQEALREVQNIANGRQVELTVTPMPRVVGDAIMLRQVVTNLLSNAYKFTQSRAVAKIDVSAKHSGNEWIFRVSDNGVGFDMAYKEKLFGVFQRLHRMEDFEGTGIGLANVRRIVERHRGRAWAEGAINEGATFYFSLPDAG